MLLKIPDKVELDSKVVKNVRLNVPNTNQFRLKCTLIDENDGEKDVDIAVTDCECGFDIKSMVWKAEASGIDMFSKSPIKVFFIYSKKKKTVTIEFIKGDKKKKFTLNNEDMSQLIQQNSISQ